MRITILRIFPALAGLATSVTAQVPAGYDTYTPFVFDKTAAAATTPTSAARSTLPANAEKTPASAVPETQPGARPVPEPSSIGAFVLPDVDLVVPTNNRLVPNASIKNATSGINSSFLVSGASLKDANGMTTAAVVSASSKLAIIMIGPHRIQIPISSISGVASSLAVSMTPSQVGNILEVSEKFQAETAKMRKTDHN